MLNQCYYLLAFGLLTAAFFVQVKGATVTTDIIYDNDGLLGSSAAVQCSWSLDQAEIGISMKIGASGGKEFYLYLIARDLQPVAQLDRDLRYTADNVTAGATAITMRISDLQCTDELNFLCKLSYNSQSVQNREDSSQLTLKAQPKPPQIQSTIPGPLTQGVVEFSNVSVTCSAVTGRPDKGSVIWRIYRDNRPESIDPTDSRITLNSKGAGDLPCTERLTYTFRMPVTRNDQDLVITCFVLNDDFVTSAPLVCEDKTANLCDQTETIRVHFPLEEVIVTQEPPEGKIPEGGNVTFTCTADGQPPLSYSWVKVSDGSTLLIDLSDELSSKLEIHNVTSQNHGDRYRCTAKNNFLGTFFSVTRTFELNFFDNEVKDHSGGKGVARFSRGCALTSAVVGLAVMVLTSTVGCIGHKVSYKKRHPTLNPPQALEPLWAEQTSEKESLQSSKAQEVEEDKNADTAKSVLRQSHESEI